MYKVGVQQMFQITNDPTTSGCPPLGPPIPGFPYRVNAPQSTPMIRLEAVVQIVNFRTSKYVVS